MRTGDNKGGVLDEVTISTVLKEVPERFGVPSMPMGKYTGIVHLVSLLCTSKFRNFTGIFLNENKFQENYNIHLKTIYPLHFWW